MIVAEVFYGVKCDRCGELYEDGEHSFWSDQDISIENTYESGWIELKNNHYCNDCHEFNEETEEVKVFEDYPAHIKTLNKFIDEILLGTRREFFEYDNHFLIRCSFYKKPKIDLFEVDYVKNLLGDKFISLDYEVDKYNSFTCRIKINK